MKFYERMDPVARQIMIRKAVGVSLALEGMTEAAELCRKEIKKLERSKPPTKTFIRESAGSTTT